MAKNELEFKGYALTDPANHLDLKVTAFQPKSFSPDDVEIAITHCGVCGSDLHTLKQGWGESHLPLIVGHEIVGKATRVGENVMDIKVGDRVGVGAKIGSCMQCRPCNDEYENYCPKGISTYNSVYSDGVVSQGGYSTAIRAQKEFVFPIPDAIESRHAASMLCGGLTVFSPLKTNGAGPGKKVGVIGIGGLGHYAILFAKALGAEVWAFTHSPDKIEDAKELGADHIVDTNNKDFAQENANTLDLLISTMDATPQLPIKDFLTMLYVHGKLINVGLPDTNQPLPTLHAFDLVPNGALIGGSSVGSKKEAIEMLRVAAEKGVKPWIEELPMKDVRKALQSLGNNKVRYRYVLTQDLDNEKC
ncbi:GroES-like protein [Irpex rosettiformis]|uniref:GroES-like protein n=1 Tax=Irpex rosettiformis TaxID=378272 RepID=A0ACB8UC33_9APHY|nr:GroES-like protein [Irpex rosettiformis]